MFELCILCQLPSPSPICHSCNCETRALIHSRHEYERKIPGTEIPLISFASYRGKVRRLIQIAKGHQVEQSALVDSWLYLASQRLCEWMIPQVNLLVVPVPERRIGLDSRRRLAKDLAFLMASQLSIPVHQNLLVHDGWWVHFFGKTQKERNRWQRLTQAPSYKINTQRLPKVGTKIILVDDVCTTGGSLRAAAKPLVEAGYEISAAVSLADTPRHH